MDKNFFRIRLGAGRNDISKDEKAGLQECAEKYKHWLRGWVKDATDSGLVDLMISRGAADHHLATLAILDRTSHQVPRDSRILRAFEKNTIYMVIPFEPR